MVGRSKAVAAPMTATAARMPTGPIQRCQTATARTSAVKASINWQTRPMRRRSNRSGNVADDEGQDHHRQELAEANQAKEEGAMRLIVDHPAHGNGDDWKPMEEKTREAAKERYPGWPSGLARS